MKLPHLEFAFLREQVVGCDAPIDTPFGQRLLTYCDYTASGRCLQFIEDYLLQLQQHYANTHTEDDITGRSMTVLLQEAEQSIKRAVNAGPGGRLIACGTGATAAIHKLQEILGIALPPATREFLENTAESLGDENFGLRFLEAMREQQPVVFVGPYEHHSNEVSWREGLCAVVEIEMCPEGGVDCGMLEKALSDPRWVGRRKIGSFSAASNVTGRISPVAKIARILHEHDALACFDFAASAPYVDIDMCPDDPLEGLDAVFLSPHKFLGGPGSCGLLLIKDGLYDCSLPPTVSGGGTVDYVGYESHDFIEDIEERERAGTPGVLQMIKAAMAFEVKEALGHHGIERREQELLGRAMERWNELEGFELLGDSDPTRRVAIVSFNLKDPRGRFLHPKFVTRLLNDLFGIQSRAGCSCAGPYGHRLLGIDHETSERYREAIVGGCQGIKPGWCRIGFHYVMDDAEADYIIAAVAVVARMGHHFLPLYRFCLEDGSWEHREDPTAALPLSLEAALRSSREVHLEGLDLAERRHLYREALEGARQRAALLAKEAANGNSIEDSTLEGELAALQYFSLPRPCRGK